MINKISEKLSLPEVEKIIYIEDVATEKETKLARN